MAKGRVEAARELGNKPGRAVTADRKAPEKLADEALTC
jgi:hypothetical protein